MAEPNAEPKWSPAPWVCGWDYKEYGASMGAWARGPQHSGPAVTVEGFKQPDKATMDMVYAEAGLIKVAPQMYDLLGEVEEYICDILTGPIMREAGVQWPEGKPNGPVLQKIRGLRALALGEP